MESGIIKKIRVVGLDESVTTYNSRYYTVKYDEDLKQDQIFLIDDKKNKGVLKNVIATGIHGTTIDYKEIV